MDFEPPVNEDGGPLPFSGISGPTTVSDRTGSHGQSQIGLLFIGFTGQKRAGRAERNQSAHRIRVGNENGT
ncbi:hypothetical protein GCM10009645_13940 [Mycolicibacterium poriferae]|uniref:Uncharacterized protein n=1 Tax=Mycolicibacterium poriferae TaxID=39694 RepID=A0A6N4VA57_9MYCO|nr:hypothetical protein MPOR_35320 [Mycolicibacterium poriferae]